MTRMNVRLFGKFQVYRGDEALRGLDVRKVQELLGYLLLYRHHSYPREMLAGLLWGDMNAAQAKRCMRQTLWQLQAWLRGPDAYTSDRLILAAADAIRVNPQADLWLDVAEFECTFEQIKGRRGAELDPPAARLLRAGIALYQSDLLDGWYQDWCICERERLQAMYLTMLEKAMAYCEAQREYEQALAYGALVLRCDRAHERTHRRLMRLYYLSGNRAAALRQYQRCTAVLLEELGVCPSKHTSALYQQIQADHLPPAAADGALIHRAEAPLAGALSRLKQLQATLSGLELQIEAEIRALERVAGELSLLGGE